MPGRCRIAHLLVHIVDIQRIRRGQKRDGGIGLILTRVPDGLARLLDAHVAGDRVGALVQTARRHDVNRRRGHGQRRILPSKRHILADLVVGRCALGGREHRHAPGAHAWIDGR